MTSIKAFWYLAWEYPRLLVTCTALLVLDAILAVISVITIVPLADLLLERPEDQWAGVTRATRHIIETGGVSFTLVSVAGLIWLSMLGMSVVSVVVRWYSLRIKNRVVGNLTEETYRCLYSAGWDYFSSTNRGKLINTVLNEVRQTGNGFLQLVSLSVVAVRVLAFVMVPLAVAPLLVAGCLVACTVAIVPFLLLGKWSYRLGASSVRLGNRLTNLIKESVDGAREIIGFGRKRETIGNIRRFNSEFFLVLAKSNTLSFAAQQFYEPMGFLAVLVVIVTIGNAQDVSLPQVGAVLWGLMRTIPPLKTYIHLKHGLDENLPRFEQVRSLQAGALKSARVDGMTEFSSLKTGIRVKDVSFSFSKQSVLHEVNMDFEKGAITALVGESGSGKSTLADIVIGLLEPSTGVVLVDGVDLRDYRSDSWRNKVGLVPQDPVLFDLSIRENLLWSNPNASEADIWEACRLASAESFIRRLPNGIDTEVGDMGTQLSGGQRQRVALARALVRKPEVLVLDEATSALDSENESAIFDDLYRSVIGVTVIIIAHRLSTISNSDQIYVLKNGKVVEQGRYLDLERAGAYFSRLIEYQKF